MCLCDILKFIEERKKLIKIENKKKNLCPKSTHKSPSSSFWGECRGNSYEPGASDWAASQAGRLSGAECDNKMASSLTADSFYSLSTQHQLNYNKELIYVKLTDTALRAIEEFARNQVGIRAPLRLAIVPIFMRPAPAPCPNINSAKFRKSN